MSRAFGFSILLLLFFLSDFYLFQALKFLTKSLSESNQRLINSVYWAIPIISILFMLSFYVFWPNAISEKSKTYVTASVFIIYISKLLGIIPLLLDDFRRAITYIIKLVYPLTDTISDRNAIPRSEFLSQAAVAVTGTHIGLMAFGILSGAHDYKVRRVDLKLKSLPKGFDGMRIAQISDIHSGSFFNKTAVKGGVEMLMAEKPDAVFFTGDLVNSKSDEFKDYFDIFNKIKAPLGVFSTLGNHDYGDYVEWPSAQAKMQNLQALMEAHRLMNWRLLMDENEAIKIGNDELGIIGIQNWGLGGFTKYGNLDKAMKGADRFDTKLLLSHDPSHWRAQVLNKTSIDAAFAGHTHGMQYGVEIGNFKFSPVQWRYPEWAGLYQENGQQLYVNRGYGYIGYPGRVGILPEITIFNLSKA